MKLSEEQIENIEWEDMKKMLDDAIKSGDKEFITSVLPLLEDYYADVVFWDYFEPYFGNDLFKDRDIALLLVDYGYSVPENLYGNDEEVILRAVASPGAYFNGFYLANDELLHDKNFVMKMLSQLDDPMAFEEVAHNIDDEVPREVLEDEEYKEFIKNRIQELKEKEEQEKVDAVYEEMPEIAERRMDYYGEYSSQRKFYPSFLDFLKEKELSADGAEKSVIQDLIRSEESDKEQSEEPAETPSELQQLASTKKELEQIVSELRENIASAQKLLASYEELLNGGKQNDSNEGQTFGEE